MNALRSFRLRDPKGLNHSYNYLRYEEEQAQSITEKTDKERIGIFHINCLEVLRTRRPFGL